VGVSELRRIFCQSGGDALSEKELSWMLADLGVSPDGNVEFDTLRKHPSFLA